MEDEIKTLIQPILSYFGYTFEELQSRDRNRRIADCRIICMATLNELTSLGPKEIGRIFKRDRSTVIHATQEAPNILSHPKYKHAGFLEVPKKAIESNRFLCVTFS